MTKITLILLLLIIHVNVFAVGPLKFDIRHHYLVDQTGNPVFLMCDTVWLLAHNFDRGQVGKYLDTRKRQGFNCVTTMAYNWGGADRNVYGDLPFEKNGKNYNVNKRIITPGSDPASSDEYDYWDHLVYVLDELSQRDMYAVLVFSDNKDVSGAWPGKGGEDRFIDAKSGKNYTQWLGYRLREKTNILYIVSYDHCIKTHGHDWSEVIRAMALGFQEGHDNQPLLSWQDSRSGNCDDDPIRNDPWLHYHSYHDAIDHVLKRATRDWKHKPFWHHEGAFEGDAWLIRLQAYLSVFAGGFGYVYGHENVWKSNPGMFSELSSIGAIQMGYLVKLINILSREQYLNRIPDQHILAGPIGSTQQASSDEIRATRDTDGTYVLVYSAQGKRINLKMSKLNNKSKNAYWYNPRNGKWHDGINEHIDRVSFRTNIKSDRNASVVEFNPPGMPGKGRDWVLVLKESID